MTLPISIAAIQRAITAEFAILPIEMVSHRRGPAVAWPRQIAMALAYELTPLSYPAIGRHFGNRDHSTVIHATRRVKARCASDPLAAACVDALRQQIIASSSSEAA